MTGGGAPSPGGGEHDAGPSGEPDGDIAPLVERAHEYLELRPDWYSRAGIPYIVEPDPNNPSNPTYTDVANLDGHLGVNVDNGYHKWPAIAGLVDLFEATGDPAYLAVAIEIANEYVQGGQHLDGDGFLDWWCPFTSTCPTTAYKNHGHYEWRAAAGVAVIVSALADRPELTQFAAAYDEMVPLLETHVWDKWVYPSAATAPEGGPARSNITHTASTYEIGRVGFVAVALHKATGDARYLEWLDLKGGELAEALILEYDAETDAYMVATHTQLTENGAGSPTAQPDDTSHAGDTVGFLNYAFLEGYDLDGKVDRTFVDRLTNTLSDVVFTAPDSFAEYTDGSGDTTSWVGRHVSGWARLAMFDPDLRARLSAWALDPATFPADGNGMGFEERVCLLGGLARSVMDPR